MYRSNRLTKRFQLGELLVVAVVGVFPTATHSSTTPAEATDLQNASNLVSCLLLPLWVFFPLRRTVPQHLRKQQTYKTFPTWRVAYAGVFAVVGSLSKSFSRGFTSMIVGIGRRRVQSLKFRLVTLGINLWVLKKRLMIS